MSRRTAAQALADATASLVRPEADIAGTIAELLVSYCDLVSADAAGLLVRKESGEIEILSATSHRAAELELYQLQTHSGPCVDAIDVAEEVQVGNPLDIEARWPMVGPAIVAAGYRTVHAVPMRWRGRAVGALNAFHRAPAAVGEEQRNLARAFADIATLALVQGGLDVGTTLANAIREALAGKVFIEQAKGVLAYTHDVEPGDAYALLVLIAQEEEVTLTAAAHSVIARATGGDLASPRVHEDW